MAAFQYVSTNLLTGQVQATQIPLNVDSFTMQLNGTGNLTGALDLTAAPGGNAAFVAALEPRRSVLWVLADGVPVWNGIVWDWPDSTRDNGNLPIAAQTMDSLMGARLITANLSYKNIDLFTVFQDLVRYAVTKNSPYLTGYGTGNSAPVALVTNAAAVAGLILPGTTCGVPWTANYMFSDQSSVSDQLSNLVSAGDLEYLFAPGFAPGTPPSLATYLRLAYTRLGRSAQACGYSFTYPGNLLDYGYPRTGSQSSNYVWASASPNGFATQWTSQYPHGADTADLLAGYPLMETAVSWNGSALTSQAQVNTFADGQVALVTQAMTQPVLKLGGGAIPSLSQLTLGDSAFLSATSPLHPAGPGGVPGLQLTVRLTAWECHPPGPQQAEMYLLTTSAVTTSAV